MTESRQKTCCYQKIFIIDGDNVLISKINKVENIYKYRD